MEGEENIPILTIDISKKNGSCFNEAVSKYKSAILLVVSKLKPLFENYVVMMNTAVSAYKLSGGIIMYEKEITQISEILEITFVECLAIQLCYEFFSACTSAILYHHPLKEYILIRTMDWDLPELKNITARFIFQKNGIYLFDAIGWIGCVGVFTAYKKETSENNAYAISLNYRCSENPNFLENVQCLAKGYFPCSFYLRKMLTENISLESLQKVYFVSPCYLTILSKDKNYILVRGRSNYKIKDKENGSAFLIQTNIDNPQSTENQNILYSKERYAHMLRMYISKKIFSMDNIISHIKKFPVTNEQTIYKTIISLKDGILFLEK